MLHLNEHVQANTAQESSHIQNTTVLLATAVVPCFTKNGNTIPLRALIDPGSQASFITERAAQLLQLKKQRTNTTITGIGNTEAGTSTSLVNLTMSTKKDNEKIKVRALISKN